MSKPPNPPPEDDDEEVPPPPAKIIEPDNGTIEWIHYWSMFEATLPTPINISITGSIFYKCPPIVWYNFDIYPHKMKLVNTGHTLLLAARWKIERPYLINGPFLPGLKYIFSHMHFHWGAHVMEGCDHTVDSDRHPMEVHMVYFNSLYLTQEEAFLHNDGIVMLCYLVRYGVVPDSRMNFFIDAFPKIREAQTSKTVGPIPLSRLITCFANDYFLYWGTIDSPDIEEEERRKALWIISRTPMSASLEQIQQFRKLWNPWDEPNTRNFRKLQDREDRHVFFVNPEWSTWASLLPTLREFPPSISQISAVYTDHPEYIPLLNTELRKKYIISEEPPPQPKETEEDTVLLSQMKMQNSLLNRILN